MDTWFEIEEKNVRHLWECPECDDALYVQPWFYSEMGTPVCSDCDKDMEYIRTEVNDAKV